MSEQESRFRPGTKRNLAITVALASAVAAGAWTAAPAGADTLVVHPGQSIQAAVDNARPGTTIKLAAGVYHQSVGITKDGITLAGSGPGNSVIEPAAQPSGPCGSQQFGICVVGHTDDNGNITRPVLDVRVTNLSVKGFSAKGPDGQPAGAGIFILGATNVTVDHVIAADNGSFGVVSVASSGGRYLDDVAFGSAEAGFHISLSAGPGVIMRHNHAYANRYGILVASASGGLLADNELTANCSGITLAGEGLTGGAATHDWVISHNNSSRNNESCPAAGNGPSAEPPISGNGITVWGVRDIAVIHNNVTGNHPTGSSAIAGGIVVQSSPTGDPPTNITVAGNDATGNQPADIAWDGTGTGNTLNPNDCEISVPAQLCR
jgi:nitrous oxidase accessory protein NosD